MAWRTSSGLLPRNLHDAILDGQFVDGEVLLERDETLERLFDAGVGCPNCEPPLGQGYVPDKFDPGWLARVVLASLRAGSSQAQRDRHSRVFINGHGESRFSWTEWVLLGVAV